MLRSPPDARVAALVLAASVGLGCSLTKPPGWPEHYATPPTRLVEASPFVDDQLPPLARWILPEGGEVAIIDGRVAAPPRGSMPRVQFTIGYVDAPAHALRCSSAPAPVEEGWFRCEGADGRGRPFSFRLGVGSDCDVALARHSTYFDPACWTGTAATASGTVTLQRGHFARTGLVVGYTSWVDGEGPVFAVDAVGAQQIELFDADRRRRDDDATLLLATIALHRFEHVVDGD